MIAAKVFSLMITFFAAWLLFRWIRKLEKHDKVTALSLSMILGGAIGNLIDRAMTGEVVDFIQVYYAQWYFPTFNIADSAITLGAGLLILDMIREAKQNHAARKSADEASDG